MPRQRIPHNHHHRPLTIIDACLQRQTLSPRSSSVNAMINTQHYGLRSATSPNSCDATLDDEPAGNTQHAAGQIGVR